MLIVAKYPLTKGTRTTVVDLPKGAKILSVQNQRDVITLWALVDKESLDQRFAIRAAEIVGTGWDVEHPELPHRGTVQDDDGYVWHVFIADEDI